MPSLIAFLTFVMSALDEASTHVIEAEDGIGVVKIEIEDSEEPVTQACPSSPSPKAIEWNEHFQDPDGRVIFKSSDDVYFRVSRWYLSKASSVFKGMLETADTANDTANAIDIDLRAIHLEHVLDMVYSSAGISSSTVLYFCKVPELTRIYEFARQFELEMVKQGCASYIDRGLRAPPRANRDLEVVLATASNIDDVALARVALMNVDFEGPKMVGFWDLVDCVKADWVKPLFRAFFRGAHPEKDKGMFTMRALRTADDVALAFQPYPNTQPDDLRANPFVPELMGYKNRAQGGNTVAVVIGDSESEAQFTDDEESEYAQSDEGTDGGQ